MVLHILIRSIGIFVVATVSFFAVHNGVTLFTWHPILMSTGFILIMTEAILAFTSNAFIARGLKYSARLTLHWVLQLSGGIAIAIAFWAIYTHKTNNGYNHFHSQHASMGLNTCLMVVGVTCGGIAARYSNAFKNVIKPAYLKIIHSSFGVITYSMAIFTFYLGLDSVWFRAQSNPQWVIMLTYAVATLAILALSKPLISIAKKIRSSLR